MDQRQPIANFERSSDYGALQRLVDALFADANTKTVWRIDAVVLAESFDLSSDLIEIVGLLPSGQYSRQELCDQLNSSIAGHAWGQVYGTVE